MRKGNLKERKRKRGFKKVITGAIAVAVAVILGVTMIPQDALAAEKIADIVTTEKYTESLGDGSTTEYSGRIWTDKSVTTESLTYGAEGNTKTFTVDADDAEEFLVTYSALATDDSVSGQAQAPIDVVFVIDISGSMSNQNSGMDNGFSRIYNTVVAVNKSISDIMDLNEYTRVGVVAFSNTAVELLPLDRYEKVVNNGTQVDYFTLSSDEPAEQENNNGPGGGDLEEITLYTNAKSTTTNQTISIETEVVGGTNIQMGYYTGLNMLATEDSISATINGAQVKRTPSLILLSDGAPTYSSDSNDWWAPSNNRNDGPGSSPYYGNGMKALMTGAYMKAAVDRNYGVENTVSATTIYTVGMGISDLPNTEKQGREQTEEYTGEQDLAYMTLNPSGYWDLTNNMSENIKDAWEEYTDGDDTKATVYTNNRETYTFNHPSSNDISGDALKNLVTAYYGADNATAVTNVFAQIVSNISVSIPEVPTEIKGTDPAVDGYITYTDPIGEYMEVKNVKALVYNNVVYTTQEEPITDETTGVTTYTFSGAPVDTGVYKDKSVSNIIIKVTQVDSSNQTMVIQIPAALIPVRVNYVTLDANNTVVSHTNNRMTPVRVIYSVGLQDGIVKDGIVQTSALSADYISKHKNADGTIDFFSNYYDDTKAPIEHIHVSNGADNGETTEATVGDTTVTFEPSHSNSFYYMTNDVAIYDAEGVQVKSTGNLDNDIKDGVTYHYTETYYHGNKIETKEVKRTGAQLKLTSMVEKDGYWYRAAGSPRLNRIMLYEGTKTTNATETAKDFYFPTFVYGGENQDDAYAGYFKIYLGNNGVLSLPATGNLEITKTVTADEGLTVPADKTFEFTVDFGDDGEVVSGAYDFDILNADGTTYSTGNTIADGGTIKLTDGQKAVIKDLPHGMKYSVTEKAVAGFASEVTITETTKAADNVIEAGNTDTVAFTNNYSVTSVTYPTTGTINGKKVLDGRDWMEGETFTFFLEPYNNAPLPEGYNVTTGVIVAKSDVVSDTATNTDTATFEFGTGSITYDKPGTYRYTVYEKEPTANESKPGMTYSRALYRIVVEVVDNGKGALVATADVQKLYTDLAEELFSYNNGEIVMNSGQEAQDNIVFTNTYAAGSITRTPVATKGYTDNSGANPLVSGMFEFKFEPVAYYNNGTWETGATYIEKVPMPIVNGVREAFHITKNEGHEVTFHSVTFNDQDIPDGQASISYVYKISEVLPSNANEANKYTVNGMTYDPKEYYVKVTISKDGTSAYLNFSAVYYTKDSNGTYVEVDSSVRVAHFENTYDPKDVSVEIPVSKTLNGRDMKANEFTFELSAVNDAAKSVLTGKSEVIIPYVGTDDTYTVVKDGTPSTTKFPAITFTKPGEYVFNVKETVGNAGGVAYDTHTETVTITVEDKNGVLVAIPTYDTDGVTFVNTYTPVFDTKTAISLDGTKNLTGRAIADGEFFILVDTEDNDAAPEISSDIMPLDTRYTAVSVPADDTLDGEYYSSTTTVLNSLVFTEAGTYTYYIREQIPSGATLVGDSYVHDGVTYDSTKYKVDIIVVDDTDGNLTATKVIYIWDTTEKNYVTYSGTNVEFTNSYKTSDATYISPVLTKELTGYRSTALEEGEFEFKATLVSGDTTGVTLPSNAKNDVNGAVKFAENIKFSKPGEYVIQIEEVIPTGDKADPTITYSTNKLSAKFTVVDNLLGNLVVSVSDITGKYTFTNEYTTTGKLEIPVSKQITGENRTWQTGEEFAFTVEVSDPTTLDAIAAGDIVLPTSDLVLTESNQSGNIEITINQPGNYEFLVHEVEGKIPGMNYDGTARTVAVKATDQANGNITFETSISGNADSTITDEAKFINVFDAESVELSGHYNLQVEKTLTGREWIEGEDVFTFELAAYVTEGGIDPTKDPDGDGEKVAPVELPENTKLEITTENKALAYFGNIIFHEKGTYTFVITEKAPVDTDATDEYNVVYDETTGKYTYKGVTYDTSTKHYVIVTVDEKVVDNKAVLEISSVKYDTDTTFADATTEMNIEFNNVYNANEVTATVPTITKELVGRDWETNEKFEFSIKAADDFTVVAVTSGHVAFADEDKKVDITSGVLVDEATKTYEGTAEFGTIEITEAGTYKFAIEEVIPAEADEDLTYDTHPAYFIVTVKDNNAGALVVESVTEVVSNPLTFTNTYAPDPTTATIVGTKAIDKRDVLDTDKFSFKIEAVGDAPLPANTTVNNNGTEISFGTIQYTEAGVYKYKISELGTSVAGISIDSTVVEATVTVIDNNGQLEASVVYTPSTNVDGDKFVFNNKYTTTPADPITLTGLKRVIPSAGNTYHMEAGEFSFQLTADPDNPADDPLKDGKEVSNDEHGNISFGSVTYTVPGVYVYNIGEVRGDVPGISYNNSIYRVTVTVTDDPATAKLKTSVAIALDGTSVDQIKFENQYDPAHVEVFFYGDKVVDGDTTFKASDFRFKLTPVGYYDGDELKKDAEALTKVPMPTNDTTTNRASGHFHFDTITYENVGEYVYEVSEVDGNLPGYKYDKSVFTITVKITDNDGVLETHVEHSAPVKFTNKYDAEDTSVTLSGTKDLDGRPLNEGEFTFTLYDSEGKEVGTVANTVTDTTKGTFSFNIPYDKAGTYTYTIAENNTNVLGIDYDLETTYGVEVVVEDKGGYLEVVSTNYTKAGADVSDNEVIFNNSYEAKQGTSVQFGASKTLEGRTQIAGEFSFLLTGNDGTALIAKNAEDGSILFDKIEYSKAGTYVYKITEAKGNDADVDYDESVYTVTVEVTDTLKGYLEAEITGMTVTEDGKTVDVESITFENVYDAPDPNESPKTGDMNTAILYGLLIVAVVCGASAVVVRRRA